MPKITALPLYNPLEVSDEDFIPVVQNGVTKKITAQMINEAAVPVTMPVGAQPRQSTLNAQFNPTIPMSVVVQGDVDGRMWLCVYDGTVWFTERMNEAPP